MTYIAQIHDRAYHIEINDDNGQPHSITLEGVTQAIDWRQLASLAADAKGNTGAGGHYNLLIGGKSYDIFARTISKPDARDSRTYELHFAGQRFEVTVEDERTRLLAGLVETGAHSGIASIQAPMPGLVVDIIVGPGERVTAGQTVIILEAMKMENDLSTPISGLIQEIRVNKGQTVDLDEILVIVTASS